MTRTLVAAVAVVAFALPVFGAGEGTSAGNAGGISLERLERVAKPAEKVAEKAAEKPAGLAAALKANKDTYTLDPAHATKEFKDKLKNRDRELGPAPAAPAVDLVLQISNPTDKDLTFSHGGDESTITLKVEGPGAVTIDNNVAMTMEFRMGTPVTLAPGKTYDIAIKSLSFGTRGISQRAYFTAAGEYKISATLLTMSNEQQISIVSPAVTVKVVEKK